MGRVFLPRLVSVASAAVRPSAARMAAEEDRWEAEARRDLAAWNSFLEALMVARFVRGGLRRGGGRGARGAWGADGVKGEVA